MPFYEYECEACKYYTEVMQKISDAPLIRCPSCGKDALKKLLSVPVFRLKGAGWYETDFKSDKETRRNLHGAEKEKEEAKAESKTEAKEAKPATEAKESKETKPQEAKASTSAAAGSGASRTRATQGRSGSSRRPVRASRKGKARKRRR